MKKNISINLQGIIFHIEDDGYEVLSRYLAEVKAHFASYQGHEEIVADIEGRIAELFAARVSASKQVITLADVEEMTAKMGRVSDFSAADEDDEPAAASQPAGGTFGPNGPFGKSGPFGPDGTFGPKGPFAVPTEPDGQPRRLYRDMAHRKIAGVAAGLAQYFLINPLWVRLGFLLLLLLPNSFVFIHGVDHPHTNFGGLGGLAFVAYVVLWIALPKRYDAPEPIDTLAGSGPLAGRKFYRDTTDGKVGGVAAGLAAYFNVDVTLVRVLFLLGLFLGGSTAVIYLVLWAVVPEARTVSERMQMRGDAVTLSGIDENLRAGVADPTPGGRPVGTFFENAAREAQPAFSFVGRVLRIIVGAFLLLIAGMVLVGLAVSLGAILGVLPADSVHLGDNQSAYWLLNDVPTWGTISGFLVLSIPMLAMLLLGLRLLLRRPVLNQTGSLLLLGLWLAGLVGAAFALSNYVRQTRARATYTSTRTFDGLTGPGVVLDMRSQDDVYEWVDVRLAPADSLGQVAAEQEFRAQGPSQEAARLTAQQTILYTITQRDSTLLLDEGITLRENSPSRKQRLTVTLHLPLGRTYTLMPNFIRELRDDDFEDGRKPDDEKGPYRARLTRQGRFRCLDCPPSADGDEDGNDRDNVRLNLGDNEDGDDEVSIDVNGNRTRVSVDTDGDFPTFDVKTDAARINPDPSHYGTERRTLPDLGDFEEIEAHGAVRLVVRPGDERRVEAAGQPDDLRRLRLERDGDRVVIRQQDVDVHFFQRARHDQHAVLITITVPRLRFLGLSGACQADVAGFDSQDELEVDNNGASALQLSANLRRLNLKLSGVSRADLTGSVQELAVEGDGNCLVQALSLGADRAEVNLSGNSRASVRATEALDVDLSGSSRVRYAGEPRLSQDLSGSSRLEQVR